MKAIIMAGGSGQRLRPLTCLIPKPMVPLLGKPVMEYAVEALEGLGLNGIGATLAYRAEEIQRHFGERLHYFIEESPMGTAGSLRLAKDFLNERFLVVSGDALTDIDLAAALAFHEEKKALATLVLKQVEIPLEYGVALCDAEGRIQRFFEKPGWSQVFSDMANTGIYILEPEVLELIPPEGHYDFGKQLFPKMLDENMGLYGYAAEGYWCDIGDSEVYRQAHFDGLDGKIRGLTPLVEEGALIEEGAELIEPVWIGKGAEIAAGAMIGPYAVIGRGARVRGGASIKHSVLWEHALAAEHAELRGCLVLDGARALRGAQAYRGAVLGSGALLGENAVLQDGALVWPHSEVAAGARVSGQLRPSFAGPVWLARGLHAGGLLEPALLVSLGRALALSLKGPCFALGSDGSGAASLALQALAAGLSSGGLAPALAGELSPAALRMALEEQDGAGAAYCALRGGRLCVDLYGPDGLELPLSARRGLQSGFSRLEGAPLALEELPKPLLLSGITALRLIRLTLLADLNRQPGRARLETPAGPLSAEAALLFEPRGLIAARVSDDGESLALSDEGGTAVPAEQLPLLWAAVAHHFTPGAPLLGTWADSMGLEALAGEYGVELRRCAPGRGQLMQLCRDHPVYFALFFDAIAALALLLRALDGMGLELRALLKTLPQTFRRARRFPCMNAQKGRALRLAADRLRGADSRMENGILVRHGARGWALIVPEEDSEEFSVICEAMSMEFADELLADYAKLVGESIQGL
ncbi:MAG: NTP transferase domain-containing protein [Christensenellaceae bacterium]|jgi:mannose-1-phosphate guanylyltransferase/phosphomannomutase|nr:NTP transferase domain-containing protein [Christensenellaceae bacterium]